MIDEFFLYGSIKSLIVSIHLGCSRVGMVVCLVEVTNMLVELFLKLTSIVCEYLMYLEGGRESDHARPRRETFHW